MGAMTMRRKPHARQRLVPGLVSAFAALTLALSLATPARAVAPLATSESELQSGAFSLVDPAGQTLLRTGAVPMVGDWLLCPDGSVWRVAGVAGTTATVAPATLSEVTYREPISLSAWPMTHAGSPAAALSGGRVAIISTHNDETLHGALPVATGRPLLLPQARPGVDDTTPVLATADGFVAAAPAAGLAVTVDTTNHAPHDEEAYRRSERTIDDLLRNGLTIAADQRPDVVLDWQTDRAAAQSPGGATGCLLIVGGSSPRLPANLAFARALMDTANATVAGTVRGVLVSKGTYGQVHYPLSVVVLAGTAADDAAETSELGVTLATAIGQLRASPAQTTAMSRVVIGVVVLFGLLLQRLVAGRRSGRAGGWR